MKKVLAIALVLCLVLGAAFAAKGDIKVGAQLGYSGAFARMKASMDSDNYEITKMSVGGFGFSAAALYDVTDDISVKASFGLDFLGKAKGKIIYCAAGTKGEMDLPESDENTPVHFDLYLGGQYAFEVAKGVKVAAGAGVDLSFGKNSKDDDAKTVLNLGVGAEVTGSYAINKNIDVLLGARYSYYFITTDETIKKAKEDAKTYGYKFSFGESGLRIFAGATYKI